jgi:hypothetical protein
MENFSISLKTTSKELLEKNILCFVYVHKFERVLNDKAQHTIIQKHFSLTGFAARPHTLSLSSGIHIFFSLNNIQVSIEQ